jgi:hypothetical protein
LANRIINETLGSFYDIMNNVRWIIAFCNPLNFGKDDFKIPRAAGGKGEEFKLLVNTITERPIPQHFQQKIRDCLI